MTQNEMIVAIYDGMQDLKDRLGRIIVAYNYNGDPVRCIRIEGRCICLEGRRVCFEGRCVCLEGRRVCFEGRCVCFKGRCVRHTSYA